jgi:hypothetical protein
VLESTIDEGLADLLGLHFLPHPLESGWGVDSLRGRSHRDGGRLRVAPPLSGLDLKPGEWGQPLSSRRLPHLCVQRCLAFSRGCGRLP